MYVWIPVYVLCGASIAFLRDFLPFTRLNTFVQHWRWVKFTITILPCSALEKGCFINKSFIHNTLHYGKRLTIVNS